MSAAILKEIEVDSTQEYHLIDGQPLYQKRFHKVLKFHTPGLAPVKDESGAYHINIKGEEAYTYRYKDTFGFYDNIAAVQTNMGWCHIDPLGQVLYKERYEWCGNFQEGRCTVRDTNGFYFHILTDGQRLYPENYTYVGDYKDGIAVVCNGNGHSTHIDRDGKYVHNNWYRQLDIFHKGFARAKDENGWFHVSLEGKPIYENRFVSLEPFYNGQAHAETFFGDLVIINEDGETLHTIQKSEKDFVGLLSADLVGFWKFETIKLAVELKLVDALPGSLEKISSHLLMPETNIQRLLKALWELDIVKTQDGIWRLSEKGKLLTPTHSSYMAAASMMWPKVQKDWESLKEKLLLPKIQQHPTFKELSNKPDELQVYRRALNGYALRDFKDIAEWINWSPYSYITALGQTAQTVLPLILKTNFEMKGVLINAERALYQDCECSDPHDRIRFIYQNPHQPWPIKSDVVIFPRFLHYFPDDDALKILEQAYSSLNNGGAIYIIEMFLDEVQANGGLLDLNMLAESGGQLRTREAWKALLNRSGFNCIDFKQLKPHLHMLMGKKHE